MNKLKRILVPVDFSANSAIAARHAGALARRFHSAVTLLYVNQLDETYARMDPLGYGISTWEATRAEYIARRRKELNEFGREELKDVPVKRVMCCGDPAQLIVERAHAESADLILMPTRGYGFFRRLLLGSVTAKVLHDAECPVWTGVHLAEPFTISPTDMRHVMCAVNFGSQSKKALRWAADFASEFAAKLTVIHAVTAPPPHLPEEYAYQWNDEAHWGADELVRCLILDEKVDAEVLIVDANLAGSNAGENDVATALGTAAGRTNAGVLVIGRSSLPGRVGRLGSDTYGIICHAPCPVVSI